MDVHSRAAGRQQRRRRIETTATYLLATAGAAAMLGPWWLPPSWPLARIAGAGLAAVATAATWYLIRRADDRGEQAEERTDRIVTAQHETATALQAAVDSLGPMLGEIVADALAEQAGRDAAMLRGELKRLTTRPGEPAPSAPRPDVEDPTAEIERVVDEALDRDAEVPEPRAVDALDPAWEFHPAERRGA